MRAEMRRLTHFFLDADLPAAPVLLVLRCDVTQVENYTGKLYCCHGSRDLREEVTQSGTLSRRSRLTFLCSLAHLHVVLCRALLLQVHGADEVSSRFHVLKRSVRTKGQTEQKGHYHNKEA